MPTPASSEITMAATRPKAAPFLARSYASAPMFWLTKVDSAREKLLAGRMAKPSSLL